MNRIDKTVGSASGHKPIGKYARREVLAVKVKISRSDMRALRRLRRIAVRRCRAGLRRSAKSVRSHTVPDSSGRRREVK